MSDSPDGATAPDPADESTIVHIYGIGSISKPQLVELLYEQKHLGERVTRIASRKVDQSEEFAVITFTHPHDAEQLLAMGHIMIYGHMLTMERPMTYDPLSVLVFGIKPETTFANIDLYFDSEKYSGGGHVKKVQCKEGSTWACVTFENEEVVSRVLKHKQYLEVELKVIRRPMTSMIQVVGFGKEQRQTLELYFEHKGRSGGGIVTSCNIKDGVAIVKFEKCEDADRVLEREQILGGQTLHVEAYYPDISITHLANKVTFSITLDHPEIYTFLMECPEALVWRDASEKRCMFHLELEQPQTLNVKYIGSNSQPAKQWENTAAAEISDYLETIQVHKRLFDHKFLGEMEQQCAKFRTKSLIAHCEESTMQLVIVGFSKDVQMVRSKLEKFLGDLKSSSGVIEQVMPLESWQARLLHLSNHTCYVERRIPGLVATIYQSSLKLKGKDTDVQAEFSLVYEEFDKFVSSKVTMSGSVFNGLREQSLLDLVEEKLKIENVMVALDVDPSNDIVTIHGMSDQDITACKTHVSHCLAYKQITLPKSQKILASGKWKQIHDSLITTHAGSIVISEISGNEDVDKIDVVCLPDVVPAVDETLKEFCQDQKEERIIPMSVPAMYLLEAYYKDRVQAICSNVGCIYPDSKMTIKSCDPSEVVGYIIEGSKEMVDLASEELQELSLSILRDDVEIKQYSMPRYFLSAAGQTFLKHLVTSHKSVYVIDKDMGNIVNSLKLLKRGTFASNATASPKKKTSYVVSLVNGMKIKIMNEDLRNSNVEAIVIPADLTLKHTLSSIRDLVEYGGPSIQSACLQHVESRRQRCLPTGTVHNTDPGRLKCKRLLHMVVEKGDLMETDNILIQEAISVSLEDIQYGGMKSVAFQVLEDARNEREVVLKAQCIAGVLISMLAFSGEDQTIEEVQLVSQDPLVYDIMKNAILEVVRNFGVETIDGAAGGDTVGDNDHDCVGPEFAKDEINISLYAFESFDIRMVTKGIEAQLQKMYHSMKLSNVTQQQQISSLSEQQYQDIKDLQNKFAPLVVLDIMKDEEHNYIKVEGRSLAVYSCQNEIKDILNPSSADNSDDQSDAGIASGGATGGPIDDVKISDINIMHFWERKMPGGTFESYSKDISVVIEHAYQADPKSVADYDDEYDNKYKVDFLTMTDCNVHGPKRSMEVRRIMGEISNNMLDEPRTWDHMKATERLKVVELDPSHSEYKEVETDFMNSVGTSSKVKVTKIKRIQNLYLHQQYAVKKKEMDKMNTFGTVNQRKLYHGTSQAITTKINSNGFNRSYCGKNGTVHGQGVYFARDASYSVRQTFSPIDYDGNSWIYQCLVLTGEITLSKPTYVEPPAKDPHNPAILYDSVVDIVQDPTIFVIFNDIQAYPSHLITFRHC